jgi:hypothetical protein
MRPIEVGNRQSGISPVAVVLETHELESRLGLLREEHQDLDAAIMAMLASGTMDQLQVARMKRRKLRIKDEIQILESRLVPDIIA